MRSSSGSFHLEITLHPNKHLSFLTLLLLQGIYTHRDDCTRHLQIQKQMRLQISWTGAWMLLRYFWPCFFHSSLHFLLFWCCVFFLLNLWDGPVHLDRCSEVGHCTGGTSSLQVFFVVLIFGLLSHFVGLVDRYYLKVSTFSGLVDRY